MGKLLTHNSHADTDAGRDALVESGADRQSVDEVVKAVAEDDHPGHGLDGRVTALPVNHMFVIVTSLRFL